jgi:glutamate-ammonia-ligase adenylyltransferase
MFTSDDIESFTENLPDADGAWYFYTQLAEKSPSAVKKLAKNKGLLSDILTLAAFSSLLATTILQHTDYVSWLERQRISAKVRGKDELLESLARFALTNLDIETNVLLARFRRREFLRIYLQDIRGLGTIAETTEEISNLADAILEYALQIARQELDNRFGIPLESDEKQRAKPAQFCIVALGKLGSKELNYASDIDLLFLYSNDGATSGQGTRGESITNREYFVKLAEFVTKLVGGQMGEGAAYRVDLRLRPHGRVGALAISVHEAKNYYQKSAQPWERQVLIRSRSSAGETKIFQKFFETVKSNVFSASETVEKALENVRLSKEKINLEKTSDKGFNVKLGRGGIREIEFIAQALQLAHAGRDEWLRAPHTLISLSRLADRKLLSETDLTELSEAYYFLRSLEHRLQMENGLQTHLIPEIPKRRLLTARRMNFKDLKAFEAKLKFHTSNVNHIFERIFSVKNNAEKFGSNEQPDVKKNNKQNRQTEDPSVLTLSEKVDKSQTNELLTRLFFSLEKSDVEITWNENTANKLRQITETTPHFSEMLIANPSLIKILPDENEEFVGKDYRQVFLSAVENEKDFKNELAVLRKTWSRFLLEIVVFDVFEKISQARTKCLQTNLAVASVEAALCVTKRELERRFSIEKIDDFFPFAVLGLGKLGGGGMDYNSDLDLVLVYEDVSNLKSLVSDQTKSDSETRQIAVTQKRRGTLDLGLETFYARAVEIFVTALSALTRDGHVYRVDLRLRPDGKNGATSSGKTGFLNYLETRAAIWEWLAYVKLRGVAGDLDLAKSVENDVRKIIHQKAIECDAAELKKETRRMRERLEQEKSVKHKSVEIDIKFDAGGMLDVYFATRFLQLRDNVPDAAENRSTIFTLEKLFKNNSLTDEDFQNLTNGYEFLSELDHNLRLTVGRSTRLPLANKSALQTIVKRMKLASTKDLLEKLTVCCLEIRASFDNILGDSD